MSFKNNLEFLVCYLYRLALGMISLWNYIPITKPTYYASSCIWITMGSSFSGGKLILTNLWNSDQASTNGLAFKHRTIPFQIMQAQKRNVTNGSRIEISFKPLKIKENIFFHFSIRSKLRILCDCNQPRKNI